MGFSDLCNLLVKISRLDSENETLFEDVFMMLICRYEVMDVLEE
jgi:hypothetical protein